MTTKTARGIARVLRLVLAVLLLLVYGVHRILGLDYANLMAGLAVLLCVLMVLRYQETKKRDPEQ